MQQPDCHKTEKCPSSVFLSTICGVMCLLDHQSTRMNHPYNVTFVTLPPSPMIKRFCYFYKLDNLAVIWGQNGESGSHFLFATINSSLPSIWWRVASRLPASAPSINCFWNTGAILASGPLEWVSSGRRRRQPRSRNGPKLDPSLPHHCPADTDTDVRARVCGWGNKEPNKLRESECKIP